MTQMPARWGPTWDWYALTVEPQRELFVQSLLVDPEDDDPPFYLFFPLRHVFSRPRDRAGRRNLSARPLYPGYLLAGFYERPRQLLRSILDTPCVTGSFGPILEKTLRGMLATSSKPLVHGGKLPRRKGQKTAEIISGPYQGQVVRTVEIAGEDPAIYCFTGR